MRVWRPRRLGASIAIGPRITPKEPVATWRARIPSRTGELAVEAERDVMRNPRPRQLGQRRGIQDHHRGGPYAGIEHDGEQDAVVLLRASRSPDVHGLAGGAIAPRERLARRHVGLDDRVEEVRVGAWAPDVAIGPAVHPAVVDARQLERLVGEARALDGAARTQTEAIEVRRRDRGAGAQALQAERLDDLGVVVGAQVDDEIVAVLERVGVVEEEKRARVPAPPLSPPLRI